jgi:apolipoprotein N-acyltransferase
LFVSFWALFPAITAVVFNYLGKRHAAMLSAACFAAVWVLLEYFRGEWLLNGFPWLQVAYSQLDGLLAGYVPILGIYGTGFLLLLLSAVMVEMIQKPAKTAILSLLLVGGLGVLLQTVNWTEDQGHKLKVSLIQGNIPQDKKWQADVRVKTLRRYRQLSEQHADSDLIIWPETAIPAYQHQVEDFYLKPLQQWAERTHTILVAGLPDRNLKTRENLIKC